VKTVASILLSAVALLVLAAAIGLFWASRGDRPAIGEIRTADANAVADPASPPPPELVVATWNIGFGGGPDGMPTDRHDAASVRDRLDRIARVLREGVPARPGWRSPQGTEGTRTGPADLVFLQEVDRPSDRSGGIDQFAYLAQAVGLPHACFVTTWNLNWLPYPSWPPSRHLGRIHSGQAILSRHPIRDCTRVELPQPDEYPRWYRRFFLHRSLQVATIDLGGRALSAVNVHLEAFSQPNREDQATRLRDLVAGLAGPLIVAGDFNAPPPDAVQKSGFVDEDIDFSTDTTIARFLDGNDLRASLGASDPGASDAAGPESPAFTFPARAPTRRLDYVFHRGFADVALAGVDPVDPASDHLPVWTTLRF
jgi:endonuclease/exonuclease/phosphatase family metal-dependent hydrolase